MTSGDAQGRESLRRNTADGVPRKPSFKCGGIGRVVVSHRSSRKPPSVQALAHKFNQLTSQAQGKKPNGKPKKLKLTEETAPPTQEEPIYDKSCLPVQRAIGLFEKGVVSPPKPVAAIKPILKTVDEKQKPKLAPKDSLNRAKYTVLRRAKSREDTSENDEQLYDDAANCKKEVPRNNVSGLYKATPVVNFSDDVDKYSKPNDSKESSKSSDDKPQYRKASLPNYSSLHGGIQSLAEEESEYMTTVQLRRKISDSTFNDLGSKLEKFKIQVKLPDDEEPEVEELPDEKPEPEEKPNEKLKDIFAQISQSSVLSKRGVQTPKPQEQAPSQTNNIFNQISQSNVPLTKVNDGKSRKFVKILNKEASSDEVSTPTVPNSSFLWSKSPSEEKSAVIEKPLPKPPEMFIPDCCYESVGDKDVLSDDGTEYDDISLSGRDDVYDDVGLMKQSESLYYISDKLDGNIYEDLDNFGEKGERVQVYEQLAEDARENELDSVYNDPNYSSMAALSEVSGLSGHSAQSGSSFEKVNSLYESAHSLLQKDCVAEEEENYYVLDTQIESDTTTSDGWVEASDSEPEAEDAAAPEKKDEEEASTGKAKKQKAGCKQRPSWSLLQKSINQKLQEDVPVSNEDDHVYEKIPEAALLSLSPNPTDQSLSASSMAADEFVDDSSVDDFDSSDEAFPEAQLPAEPVQQFQIAKSLRAAGKRLRELTLRKRDIGKSFKKLRPRLPQVPAADAKNGDGESNNRNSKFYCTMEQLAGEGNPPGTTPTQRPCGPPPPPPPAEQVHYADIRSGGGGADHYAKYGLFKHSSRSNSGSNSNWYADSGLYGTNGTSNNKCQEEEVKKSLFLDEPLYQFYTECVNAQARDDILIHYDSDGYESINSFYSMVNHNRIVIGGLGPTTQRSTPSYHEKNRKLWCQMPEVEESCILPTLTEQKRKLQEAKFEILTSEGSYIHSLTVLQTHFMPKLAELISTRDCRLLFSNILEVKTVSESLLGSLESCWLDNIMLLDICKVVRKHAEEDFNVYVQFCKHHSAAHKTLMKLKESNSTFASTLRQLENSPACQSLPLMSFLMLPAQRITRLPLLMRGVLARMDKQDEEYTACEATFEILNKIVNECNNEASRMEKCEEMLLISQQLDFPKTVRSVPIISANRCLVKQGEAIMLGKEDSKLTFGRRTSKMPLQLLLFTDLLVVARPKGGRGSLEVVDHCARNLVQLDLDPPIANIPATQQHKNIVMLTLLENHENKTVEMMLSFAKESDPPRWRDAVSPVLSTNPDESIYEAWDCPQVIAIYDVVARQPDELSLCIGDVVNVLKKAPDGLYQGERLRDGVVGWFPSGHTQEISSAHIRAKNKKQRYKLLAHADSFIQQMKLNSPS